MHDERRLECGDLLAASHLNARCMAHRAGGYPKKIVLPMFSKLCMLVIPRQSAHQMHEPAFASVSNTENGRMFKSKRLFVASRALPFQPPYP